MKICFSQLDLNHFNFLLLPGMFSKDKLSKVFFPKLCIIWEQNCHQSKKAAWIWTVLLSELTNRNTLELMLIHCLLLQVLCRWTALKQMMFWRVQLHLLMFSLDVKTTSYSTSLSPISSVSLNIIRKVFAQLAFILPFLVVEK